MARRIDVELRESARPRWLVLSLGIYASQYPRALEVSASGDGVTWRTIATSDPALTAYDAALRDPRAVPLAFPLDGEPARFIRLRQTAHDPSRRWSIVELMVLQ